MMSLADFAKSKRIWLLRSLSSDFDPETSHDVRIISVVGLFNKGKTFLLNKLFGLRLPSGKTQVTQGLSCVYLKERRMLLIDSPGVQSTVSYKSDNIDRVVDAQSTEAFIFELVSQVSDHIIFVVNDFTSFEQKYVQMFEQKEQIRAKPARELIVVHNLCTTCDADEAGKLFQKQITSRYDGVESHLGDLCYTARRSPPVHHFAICKEESDAGNRFNHRNIKLLLEHLEHVKKLPEKIVFKELISSKLEDLIPRFFLKGPGDVEYQEGCQDGNQHDWVANDSSDWQTYEPLGSFHVTCEKLDVKTQGVISDLGEVISHDKSFNPEAMIFDEKSPDYLTRTILFECPGVKPEQVSWHQPDAGGIAITIEKSKLIDEGSVTVVSALRQQSGVFEKRLNYLDGPFDIAEDECSLDHGVLKIVLKKCLINKKGGLKTLQPSMVQSFSYPVPSTLPSEAEGVCQRDDHPAVYSSASIAETSGFQKVEVDAGHHCLTQMSSVLTPQGPKNVGDLTGGASMVTSVVLDAVEPQMESEEPKNGVSPA
eukprot:Skav212730  [mRNA]  locus=scaffold1734:254294:255910:- [translate_table: standard]